MTETEPDAIAAEHAAWFAAREQERAAQAAEWAHAETVDAFIARGGHVECLPDTHVSRADVRIAAWVNSDTQLPDASQWFDAWRIRRFINQRARDALRERTADLLALADLERQAAERKARRMEACPQRFAASDARSAGARMVRVAAPYAGVAWVPVQTAQQLHEGRACTGIVWRHPVETRWPDALAANVAAEQREREAAERESKRRAKGIAR